MAESIAALYLRLGLDISELQSDFVLAEQSVQQNLNRLNREQNLIRLRAEAEISGLDEINDAERIFSIRTDAINRQIQLQQDRLRLATAAWQSTARATGEHSAATQRAEAALRREQLALSRLESSLRELNDAQEEVSEGAESLEGNISETFSGITESAENFRSGIGGAFSETLALMEKVPPQAKAVVAAIGAIAAIPVAKMAMVETTRSLLEGWQEINQQAYELNLSVKETKNLLRQMTLGGGDIGDFEGFIRGITDAWVKGDVDDPETMAMQKYGIVITDVTGRLKDFKTITEEIFQGFEKARQNGETVEFLQLLGGEAGMRDALQFFMRYKEALSDSEKIFDAGLDPAEMHETQRELNLLDMQMDEFSDSVKNLITPFARQAMREFFDLFHNGTEFITESKNEIQLWGFAVEKVLEKISNFISNDNKNLIAQSIGNTLDAFFFDIPITRAYKDFFKDIFDSVDFGILNEARQAQEEYNAEIEDAAQKQEEFRKTIQATDEALGYGLRDSLKRAAKFREELEDIQLDLDFEGDYDKAIAKLENWYNSQIDAMQSITDERRAEIEELLENPDLSMEDRGDIYELLQRNFQTSNEERLAFAELYAARHEQIEREKEDRLAAIRDKANSQFQTDLQKRLDAIDSERDEWIKAGMEAAEAETLAERQKLAAMQSLEKSFTQSVASIHQTALENRLAQIDKEKEAWIQKGIDEVEATKEAEAAKNKARQNAALQMLKSQLEEYRAYKEGGYTGLLDYQREKLIDSGVDPRELNINQKQLEEFQHAQDVAQRNLLPNLASAEDKREHAELVQAEIAERRRQREEEWRRMLEGITINGKHPDFSPDDQLPSLKSDEFSELTTQIQTTSNSFENLNETLQNIPALESESMDIPPNDSEIETPADSQLLQITPQLSEVASGLDSLNKSLSEFRLPAQSPNIDAAQGNSSTNINVSVQIDEAHAWDSEHIQELADKVADEIKPAITSAIGGDSNSY